VKKVITPTLISLGLINPPPSRGRKEFGD